MGQFSKKTESRGNPKSRNKKSCASKGNKRIRSLGGRSAGIREENREGPVNWRANMERGAEWARAMPTDDLGTRNWLRRDQQ